MDVTGGSDDSSSLETGKVESNSSNERATGDEGDKVGEKEVDSDFSVTSGAERPESIRQYRQPTVVDANDFENEAGRSKGSPLVDNLTSSSTLRAATTPGYSTRSRVVQSDETVGYGSISHSSDVPEYIRTRDTTDDSAFRGSAPLTRNHSRPVRKHTPMVTLFGQIRQAELELSRFWDELHVAESARDSDTVWRLSHYTIPGAEDRIKQLHEERTSARVNYSNHGGLQPEHTRRRVSERELVYDREPSPARRSRVDERRSRGGRLERRAEYRTRTTSPSPASPSPRRRRGSPEVITIPRAEAAPQSTSRRRYASTDSQEPQTPQSTDTADSRRTVNLDDNISSASSSSESRTRRRSSSSQRGSSTSLQRRHARVPLDDSSEIFVRGRPRDPSPEYRRRRTDSDLFGQEYGAGDWSPPRSPLLRRRSTSLDDSSRRYIRFQRPSPPRISLPPRSRDRYASDSDEGSRDRVHYRDSFSGASSTSGSSKSGVRVGKTRIPKSLVSRKAIVNSGYPWHEEDDFFVIERALEAEHIDRLIDGGKGDDPDATYVRPVDSAGEFLTIDVQISTSAMKKDSRSQSVHFNGEDAVTTVVLASKRFTDNGHTTVDLTCDAGTPDRTVDLGDETDSVHFTWLHKTSSDTGFDSYEDFILSVASRRRRFLPVVRGLLQKIRSLMTSAPGSNQLPHTTLLRADGLNQDLDDNEDLNATFFVYTFFGLGPASALYTQCPSLLQSKFPLENTRIADSRQTAKSHPANLKKDLILVPQLWTLCLGSKLLITYGPTSIEEVCGQSILRDTKQFAPQGPLLVKVVDPDQRAQFFSVLHCQTFFELQTIIDRECLKDRAYAVEGCEIFFEDGHRISGESWLLALQNWTAIILPIRLDLRNLGDASFVDVDPSYSYSKSNKSSETINKSSRRLITFPQDRVYSKPRSSRGHLPYEKDVKSLHIHGPAEHTLSTRSNGIVINDAATKSSSKLATTQMILSSLFERPTGDIPADEKAKTTDSTEGPEIRRGQAKALRDITMQSPPFLTWSRGTDSHAIQHILSGLKTSLLDQRKFPPRSFNELQEHQKKLLHSDSGTQILSTKPSNVPGRNGTSTHSTQILLSEIVNETADFQKEMKDILLDEILEIGTAIFGLFVPEKVEHIVAQNYWGAVYTILTAIAQNVPRQRPEREIYRRPLWIAREPSGYLASSRIAGLPQIFTPLRYCKACRDGTEYHIKEDALSHLLGTHFSGPDMEDAPSDEDMSLWLRTKVQIEDEIWSQCQIELLHKSLDYLLSIYRTTKDIAQSVTRKDSKALQQIGVTDSVIELFQHILNYMDLNVRLLRRLDKLYKRWTFESLPRPFLIVRGQPTGEFVNPDQNLLDRASSQIFRSLQKVETDMLQMTALATSQISYSTVGPQYVMLVALGNLTNRPLLSNMNVEKLYQELVTRLEFEVFERPRKALLKDLNQMLRELPIVNDITRDQGNMIWKLDQVLHPESYLVTSETRKAMYLIENGYLNKASEASLRRRNAFDDLERRVRDLVSQLRLHVEIVEADHGKAIYVFTTITIVFLPLSFVSSFFGMNTVDVRNMSSNQWLFWVTALPLTVLVIVLALLIAYKGDQLRDAGIQSWKRLGDKRMHAVKANHEFKEKTIGNLQGRLPTTWQKRRPRRADTFDSALSV